MREGCNGRPFGESKIWSDARGKCGLIHLAEIQRPGAKKKAQTEMRTSSILRRLSCTVISMASNRSISF